VFYINSANFWSVAYPGILFVLHKFCQLLVSGVSRNFYLFYINSGNFWSVAYPGIFSGGFKNLVEDRGQRERGLRAVAP
jgi:hypothetical protein